MDSLLLDVNWMAVFVGAAVSFLAGWLWYGDKMFGQKWRDGIGIAPDDNSPMGLAMLTQAVSTFLLAWVIGVAETANDLPFVILITVTIIGLIKANGFYSQKSKYAIGVEAGYIFLMVIIMVISHAIL